jgi:iron complex outermembrane receptor protein
MHKGARIALLATTMMTGAVSSVAASPAYAQDSTQPTTTPSPPDNSATPSIPETTTPPEGQTVVPSTSATGENVRGAGDIVITGTRIPQPNLTSASPVTVLSSQEVKLQGTTRTEDLINSLPQAFAAQGSNVSNGSTGTASVNLRGLGSVRTLVLVNGRRLQPGDPRQGSVADINFIPSALIKRVDVLTGGASSVYGADAVAGVVNFIMDTNFRGLRLDAQGSVFNHENRTNNTITRALTDPLMIAFAGLPGPFQPPKGMSTNGGAQDISASFGAGFDDNRGSIMAYATYRKQDPVLESTRDYSFCSLGSVTPAYFEVNPDYGEAYCAGSSTSATGTFTQLNPVTGSPRPVFQVKGNQFVPGRTRFNFAPYNYFQRPDERYTLGTFAEYEISPGAKPYLEAMFMDDRSNSQIAPSGSFNSVTTIACDNALLSVQQRTRICGDPAFTTTGPLNGMNDVEQATVFIARRNVEGGGRQDDLEHTAWRVVGGVRGDLLRGVSYDAYYQYGTTRLQQTYLNDFSVRRLGLAVDAVAVDANGNIVAPGTAGSTVVCRAVVTGIDANCVPYNVFATGGVSPEALTYLQTPGFQRGFINENVADANVTLEGGEYGVQSPWSDRGVAVNFGGEYRKESMQTRVDEEFRTGDLAGQGGPTPPQEGKFDVRELFTEVQIPIISHSFIEEFTLTGGYRYSDYKVAGNHFNTDTYKVSAELAPVRDVRFRASYNRAVRAPNVVELFFPTSLGLAGNSDPCSGVNPTATLAQCQNTGVTAAQFGNVLANPANQYNAIFGGNPSLAPEKADTYTLGVVLQPRWVPGFALTVDYFDIKVKGLISAGVGFQTTVNACLQTNQLCELIHRDVAGTLWLTTDAFVELSNINIGGLRTKGIDLNGSYSRRLGGMGTLNLSLVGTWLEDLETDTGLAGSEDGKYDCTSWYGATCGTPNPKWRHKFRAGFTFPNGIGLSGQWRYFSSVENDVRSDDPDMPSGPNNAFDRKLNAKSFFDLVATARLADRYNLRIGANNILDTDPPVASGNTVGPPFGNGNTYPQVYDALGRYLFAGVTIDF